MSFKDSKAQILANSASDDSDISTMEADLATTAVVDDGYVLCTDVVKGMQELNSKVTILEKENKRLKQKLNMCN